MQHVATYTVAHQYPVVIEQRANKRFRVSYGAEIKDNLTYGQATTEFGRCVFHALACAGKLNNEGD